METNNTKQATGSEVVDDAKLKYPVQKRAHKGVIEEKEVKHAVNDLNPDLGSMDSRG